jgi:hypothetical protein
MKDLFYLFSYYPQIMCLNLFFQRMVIEILFNNKFQFFSFEIIHIFTHTHTHTHTHIYIIIVHY